MTYVGAPRSGMADAWLLTARLARQRILAARRDWSERRLYVIAVIASAMLFWLILFGTYVAVKAMQAADATGLITSIAPWAFLVYLFTDVFIAFGQALNDLYLSNDIQLLFSMPLRVPSIVIAKFVLGVAQNEVYVGVFLLPFVLGFLIGLSAPAWAYAVSLAGVLLFPAILYAALVVVTIVALRVIPARVAKEFLWLVGASVPTLFWVASFARVAGINGDISQMHLPDAPGWLPSTWLGHAVTYAALNAPVSAAVWLGVLAGATLLVAPVALAIVSNAFASGYDASAARSTEVRRAQATRHRTLHPIAAILRKDLITFVRSPQLWFNHIAALGFVGYLLVGHRFQTPLLPLTTQLAMIQIGFVASLNSLNPGMIALSLEHGAIWLLRGSPLAARNVLIAKYLGAYLQTAFTSGVGAIALSIGYGFGPRRMIAVVAFALVIAAAAIALGVAFDARYPAFDWENPNHINRGVRMMVPFLNSVGILVICGLALGAARLSLGPTSAAVAAGLALSVLVVALAVVSSTRSAMRNLTALEV